MDIGAICITRYLYCTRLQVRLVLLTESIKKNYLMVMSGHSDGPNLKQFTKTGVFLRTEKLNDILLVGV